jgi:hypothetical protein
LLIEFVQQNDLRIRIGLREGSFLQLKFINTSPGAPLPDMLQLIFGPVEPGQEFPSFISLTARADGTLRDNFGVPEDTPGRAEVIQTGLFTTKFMGATETLSLANELA